MTDSRWATRASLVSLCVAISFSGVANAADGDAAAAEQLFRDGLKDMAKGNYEKACPRLAESQHLDPGYGTLMHLGDCYVKLKKTASAWATYREAADTARQKKQTPREKTATKKATALEPKLSKLIIEVPSEAVVPGLVVRRDGQEVGEVSWKTPVPVDPGHHDIEASAPGKITWKTSIEVGEQSETAKIVVTPLANEPVKETGEKPKKRRKPHPVLIGGIITGTVGLAAMGASIGIGSASRTRFDESEPFCTGNFCQPDGIAIRDDALSIANIGTGVFIGGAVCLAAGVVMIIVSPPGKEIEPEKTSLHIRVGPQMLSVGGTF